MKITVVFKSMGHKASMLFFINYLWHSANSRGWVAWNPVEEKGGEPLLKENRGAGEEVANSFSLLLPSVSRQCRAQFPQLLQGNLVPAAHGLCDHRDEGDALLVTQVGSAPHLVVEGGGQGGARLGGSSCPGGVLQRILLN